jgi:16S rRNA (guanine527-N7)-methyltransferase
MRPRGPAMPDLDADHDAARRLVERVAPGCVSHETWTRLGVLVELLQQWQRTINLIAPSTIPHIWTRHVADSLQLLPLAPSARVWLDLGSGAGFPGLPIACALAGRAGAEVHLVESDQRKAAFLREAIRLTAAPAKVHVVRIESFRPAPPLQPEIVTARALAPLPKLLDYAAPWLEKGAQALFLKGQDVEAELTDSAKYWHMEVERRPSVTDPRACILWVRRAERLPPPAAAGPQKSP